MPGLYDIAFVEYESDLNAVVAKTTLQGATLDNGQPVLMAYAKK